ncbi:hypothetical protein Goshw_024592 [Gossypium schwendimanii]|uniref:GIY-YIG domain-containing protein n=1 Tax=Gossypium schwendimanii TaxID=34291 RepID=A0A7J9L5C0_GOSSC|nr:hypothetical protein [Gossypium schwendimanii]
MRLLTSTFRSVKHPIPIPIPIPDPKPNIVKPSLPSESSAVAKSKSELKACLKQHNGELSGGAKASRAGRPWVCACIVRGFNDQSEACEFEFKWKMVSRKLPRKKKNKEADDCSLTLLQHRQTALNKVKGMLDCSHLEIEWQMSTS